ncbi:MAG: OmpA family protein [Pseudomonadota bacterium]
MLVAGLSPAAGQDNPFKGGWLLDTERSVLTFQSVKNNKVVENSGFASFTGTIDEAGSAIVKVQLDSVDTGIDLRNVRMRFLFFETYQFPEATISAKIDIARLGDLTNTRRARIPLEFDMTLHGVTKPLKTDVIVTRMSNAEVAVASAAPLPIGVALFGMEENVLKLEEAAKVNILRSGSVSFNFVFKNGERASETVQVASLAPVAPAQTALEAKGNFSTEACEGRFEILSRTDAIYFQSGSAALDPNSSPVLKTVADIAKRCPDLRIQIAGHTDSAGDASFNQRLSEARAASVLRYLAQSGISENRMRSIGYGEERPVAANDTARNRRLNRRIEFSAIGG